MIRKNLRWMAAMALAANLATVAPGPVFADGNGKANKDKGGNSKGGVSTNTPIKHLVVIFQ